MGGMTCNMEVNAGHPAVLKVKSLRDGGNDKEATAMASLLYDVAAVSSGYEVDDPGAFAKRVVALMSGEDLAATVADAPAPAPEPEADAAAPAEEAAESVEAEVIEPE